MSFGAGKDASFKVRSNQNRSCSRISDMRFLAVLLTGLTLPLFAQEKSNQSPPPPVPKGKPVQGLTLTVTSGGKTDVLPARLVALFVPAGKPATPFVPAGPFTAKWEGEVTTPLRGEYTFFAEVKGAFRLSVNGKDLLEGAGDATAQTVNKAVQLNKGGNKIVAEFSSDNSSDAMLQLWWSTREFPPEPVPPISLAHMPVSQERTGGLVREGRLLFAQLRCAACHEPGDLLPPKGQGMPELAHDAPLFDELGSKYHEAFLAHWINDPHSIRPGSLMPRVFTGKEGEVDQRAADLAAYFASTGKPDETQLAKENAPLGGALFANLGCIACHTTPDVQGKDEHHRVPLAHMKAKWQPRALVAYLQNPAKNYAWTRMPNFKLTEEEATRLAAFLLSGQQREFPAPPKGDPAKGAQLLATANCLNCHAGLPPTSTPKLADTLKSGWEKGCLAHEPAARGNAPDFHFTPEQRTALVEFAKSGLNSLKINDPAEFAERQLTNLRCNACHSRDGRVSTWSEVESELGPLQAAAPPPDPAAVAEGQPMATTAAPALTWVGEKLKPDWAAKFIAGMIPYKPRPWLIARMPAYIPYAEGIAHGLSYQHGFPLTEPVEPEIEAQKAPAGAILISENGGLNCTTCHAIGERPATAVFEAPGPNFAYTNERLRKGYYHRWVFHPLRIEPETKMPRFADDDGKTPLTEHFEGNARAQFEAIWQYLRTVKN